MNTGFAFPEPAPVIDEDPDLISAADLEDYEAAAKIIAEWS